MKKSHTQLQVSKILEPNIDHPVWVGWSERKKLNFLEKKLRAKLKKVIIYRV